MKNAQKISHFYSFMALLCAIFMVAGRGLAEEPVTVNLADSGPGVYHVEGHFKVSGSASDVWSVLTDYEHMSRFISSLRKSTVTERADDHILLDQEALGKEFIFSRRLRVLLRVTVIPNQRIDFEDVAHKDFYLYKGSWDIETRAPGQEVVYRLDCKRRFIAPNFMAKNALRKNAETLLAEVRTEILKRQEEVPQ